MRTCFAGDSLDMKFRTNTIKDDGILYVDVLHDLNETRFLIRPKSEDRLVEIFNKEKDKWVSNNALWNDLPKLTKEIKLRFSSLSLEKISIQFEVKDVTNLKTYLTSPYNVWSKKSHEAYIEKVNQKLVSDKEISLLNRGNSTKKRLKLDLYRTILSFEILALAFFGGLFIKNVRMAK